MYIVYRNETSFRGVKLPATFLHTPADCCHWLKVYLSNYLRGIPDFLTCAHLCFEVLNHMCIGMLSSVWIFLYSYGVYLQLYITYRLFMFGI